jgi:thioesterase domain-containing protein
VWLLLRRRGHAAQVVIQDSTIRYLRPVTSDFEAICETPPEKRVAHLVDALSRRGRGRIELEVTVRDDTGAAIAFRGRYVALARHATA